MCSITWIISALKETDVRWWWITSYYYVKLKHGSSPLRDCTQKHIVTYSPSLWCRTASCCRTGRCGPRRSSSVCAALPPNHCTDSAGPQSSPWCKWCQTHLCISYYGRPMRVWIHLESKSSINANKICWSPHRLLECVSSVSHEVCLPIVSLLFIW